MKRIFSGIQPTGNLHLGNYLGAIQNWVGLQEGNECIYCIVDLHAITIPQDPAELKANTREVAAALLASGIKPDKSILFNQSSVPQHAELAWVLNCVARLGWLNRMTQFKEKAGKNSENATVGLYAYPTLMAADILVYKATHVPVGDDQKQHLELTRDIAQAFNAMFEENFFPLPQPHILGKVVPLKAKDGRFIPSPEGQGNATRPRDESGRFIDWTTRVMSLRDGTAKMSKSDPSEYSRISLRDDADTIAKKIKKAKTDAEPLPSEKAGLKGRPEAENLVTIYAALAHKNKRDVLAEYGGQGFGVFKPALADLAASRLAPITEKMNDFMQDETRLDTILAEGGERAHAIAAPIMAEIRHLVGFLGKSQG